MNSIEGDRSQGGLFSAGEELSASKLNFVAQLAGYGTTKHSSSLKTVQGPFGTAYMDSMGEDNAIIYDFPFKVTLGLEGNEVRVYVRAGSVNNFMPKIGSIYLDFTPAPYLTFNSVTSTHTKIVAIKVTKDGVKFFPQTCEIVLVDDYESLAPSDNVGYLAIASISAEMVEGKVVLRGLNQLIYASQIVVRVKPADTTAEWAFSSR
jgi:hypothetical protein